MRDCVTVLHTERSVSRLLTTSLDVVTEAVKVASDKQLAVMIVKGIDRFPDNGDRVAGNLDIWWIVRILACLQFVLVLVWFCVPSLISLRLGQVCDYLPHACACYSKVQWTCRPITLFYSFCTCHMSCIFITHVLYAMSCPSVFMYPNTLNSDKL